VKLSRQELRQLITETINEGIFGKKKKEEPKAEKKDVKAEAQALVDEAPDKRAMGEADLKKYYGDKGLAKKVATQNARNTLLKGQSGDIKAHEIFTITDHDAKILYVVVEKI